jgi:hypothetical protein
MNHEATKTQSFGFCALGPTANQNRLPHGAAPAFRFGRLRHFHLRSCRRQPSAKLNSGSLEEALILPLAQTGKSLGVGRSPTFFAAGELRGLRNI